MNEVYYKILVAAMFATIPSGNYETAKVPQEIKYVDTTEATILQRDIRAMTDTARACIAEAKNR